LNDGGKEHFLMNTTDHLTSLKSIQQLFPHDDLNLFDKMNEKQFRINTTNNDETTTITNDMDKLSKLNPNYTTPSRKSSLLNFIQQVCLFF
jgi:hypothetical protein